MTQAAEDTEQYAMEHDNAPDGQSDVPKPSQDINVEARSNETEIEIDVVDDTPKVDQGRQPLPDSVKREALADDMEDYSSKVQERMNQLKKAFHDKRRESEAKDRIIEENTNATRYYMQQAQHLQAQQQQERQAYMQQANRRAELEMQTAQKEYQNAFDEGDAEAVSEAQKKMNDAGQFQTRLNEYGASLPTAQQQQQQQQQQVAQAQQQQYTQTQRPQATLDEATASWVNNNAWFGPTGDHEMTSTAMGIHEELVEDGFREGSPEYFKRIDARIRTRYPEKFGNRRSRPSTVVAPAGRHPQGKKVVLTETQVQVARDLGITTQQYANGVAKMQRGNS